MGAETTSRWVVESGNALARCLMHQNRYEEARQILRNQRPAAPRSREDYHPACVERDRLLALLAE